MELKRHQIVAPVQKYPAWGMDSQQEGPKNTPGRDLCLQEQRDQGQLKGARGTGAPPARQSTEESRKAALTRGI